MSAAIGVMIALINSVPAFAELLEGLTGESRETLVERLERARAQVKDPIDVAAPDAARRAELERILRGRG